MNQVDQNINKDMTDSSLIDVESFNFSDEQTWLYKIPDDSGQKVDIVDWCMSVDWPVYDDEEYLQLENDLCSMLDCILKDHVLAMPDKHRFDSRTYVKPKRRVQRPSIQNIVESPPSSQHANPASSANKYLTYNKYSPAPLGPILRLKTFNVDTDTENSNTIKEYAMKRRSFRDEDSLQLEDVETTLVSDVSGRLSSEHIPTKPINIDLSQPANNLHNTFNKGFPNILHERGSLNMYQSSGAESLMRMSPPSLVSSLMMESSGNFNQETDMRKSMASHKDSGIGGIPPPGRDSIDPMLTSMTLSILDEKDMSTSFLSQTTYPDHDSFIDSMPPSLVNSVNSSYIVSNTSKPSDSIDSNNIFSSATFTHLEQSERLLSARPRVNMFNSYTKRESGIRNSESYTKSKEEACQIDSMNGTKILNENTDKQPPLKSTNELCETITLHFSNNKFRDNDAEKENLNATFERDDAFYTAMGVQKPGDTGKPSLNVTLDKQELNEIIQARQKLSLARKALPAESERLPNQVESMPTKVVPTQPVQVTVPRKSIANASELLARRRALTNGHDKPEEAPREPPKRNATFKKTPPKPIAMDSTMVFTKDENIIDINSATLTLIDSADKEYTHEEWTPAQRAMVGSSESTDTGTFSSSSPPDSGPDHHDDRHHVASTPLVSALAAAKHDLMNLHTTISPIYDNTNAKSYTVATHARNDGNAVTTTINTATMVKRSSLAKRDILTAKLSPEKKAPPTVRARSPQKAQYTQGATGIAAPRASGLPPSKLRQYSSHKDLRLPVGSNAPSRVPASMLRRQVYASNPALSPTAVAPPTAPAGPVPARRDSYTIAVDRPANVYQGSREKSPEKAAPRPPLVRQGTETLRRERPQSQLVQPKDPPMSRPNSIAGPPAAARVSRPVSGPAQRTNLGPPMPAPEPRPATGEPRASALPRPSRLPAPRRGLRPPSVYSVAPTADMDNY